MRITIIDLDAVIRCDFKCFIEKITCIDITNVMWDSINRLD